MGNGLQLMAIGALLVGSLLLRNAAAGHLTPGMVPACLEGRLRLTNRMAPWMLAGASAAVLAGSVLTLVSQIATRQ
ncbi:hypothetical protein I601_2099 [Nocardioides dokdonensis FR1436]|uniref:Uncharacterized protein n=1 Tax=Nocardioides dokdonensis FR1436 TaxID=1300347 RepID=A0A1A9GJL4_9ACTN|nr:hypothetical protein [Nocardioides dokdonensis]ANH38527.1 hypothetical protein I601_2099 [Nocardioides dokdonensis FR1436]